jgi:hypothetical protein
LETWRHDGTKGTKAQPARSTYRDWCRHCFSFTHGRVEMDRTARKNERSELAAEVRTSLFLLGGALGSMGLFAMLLLFLTAGWPAR